MFRIRMTFHQTPQRVEFRVGWIFRAVLGLMACAVLAAGASLGSGALAAVVAVLALLGALYEESMTFDRSRGLAEFRTGLVFLSRRTVIPLETISAVRVSVFGPARFTGLHIVLTDGSAKTIESDRGTASARKLEAWGVDLAQWLGVPVSRAEEPVS